MPIRPYLQYKICGICPLIWLLPLLLSEQAEKVNVVPSGHFTLFIPPSPFKVFGPWFFSRRVYFTPSCKQNKKRNVYCVTFIHTCESSMNEICHLPIFIRIKIFVLCASRKILRVSNVQYRLLLQFSEQCIVDRCGCPFSFGHCVVCPMIYSF